MKNNRRRHSGSTKSLLAALTLAVTATAGLTGCSDNSDKSDANENTTNQTSSGSTATPSTSPKVVPIEQPPTLEKAKGARKDAELPACDTSAGSQTLEGTVQNPTKKPADYVVTVNWVAAEYGSVVGRGFVLVKAVEAGQEKAFTIEAKVGDGAASCTVNVRRAAAQQ